MTDSQLIQKIQTLKQIKPQKDWVVLTKNQILGQPAQRSFEWHWYIFPRFFFLKPVWVSASVLAILVFFGAFGFAQNSLPGDFLYSLKKASETGQMALVPEAEKTKAQLEIVNKRLAELTKIAETNRVKNLAPAINEFQASASEAAKNLSMIGNKNSDPAAVKKAVDQAKNIEKKAKEVKSLGVVIEGGGLEELQGASNKLELELLVQVLENMISDLENRTLTEKQEETLLQMKKLIGEGQYSEALELYLINQ